MSVLLILGWKRTLAASRAAIWWITLWVCAARPIRVRKRRIRETDGCQTVKPRPYQQQCRSNIVEATGNFVEAASTPATMSQQHCRILQVERLFRQCRMLLRHCCRFGNNVAVFGNNVERNFVLSTKSKQIEHVFVERTKFRLTMLPKPATIGNIVAENGNNVEATFDFVERTTFYNRIVQHCCRLWQQSRMLLRQSRT